LPVSAQQAQGGKAQRIPPSLKVRHTASMPDYRRNRVPGGTFFFTVNLLDRRSDLLATRIGVRRRRGASGGETEEAEGATLFRPT
jgi:hypothetical protein